MVPAVVVILLDTTRGVVVQPGGPIKVLVIVPFTTPDLVAAKRTVVYPEVHVGRCHTSSSITISGTTRITPVTPVTKDPKEEPATV